MNITVKLFWIWTSGYFQKYVTSYNYIFELYVAGE